MTRFKLYYNTYVGWSERNSAPVLKQKISMWRWQFSECDVKQSWLKLCTIWRSREFKQFMIPNLSALTTKVANGWEEVESETEVVCDRYELILEANHQSQPAGFSAWPTDVTTWD